jgi:hypothetical protein
MRTLLALLLLLSPALALATVQEESETEEEATATEAQEDSQLEEPEQEAEWTPEPRARAPLGLRLVSETGLGALTAVAGGFVGGVAGTGVCFALGHQNQFLGCIVELYLGIGAGLVLGLPLGVWLGGNITGGDGGLGYTFLGALAGAAGGLLVVASSGSVPLLALLGFALPVVGGILGYELSMSPEAPALALGGTRIQPLLSVSPWGGFVGLGGTF